LNPEDGKLCEFSELTRFIHVKNMNNDDNLLKTSVIQ